MRVIGLVKIIAVIASSTNAMLKNNLSIRRCQQTGNYFNGRERYRIEFDDALDSYLKRLLHDQTALFELVKFHYTDWTNRSALYDYQRGDVSINSADLDQIVLTYSLFRVPCSSSCCIHKTYC